MRNVNKYQASSNTDGACGFYLTDEECKCRSACSRYISWKCFYLTDEECKLAQTDEALKQAKQFLSN